MDRLTSLDKMTDDELNEIIESDDFGDAMSAQTELHNRYFAGENLKTLLNAPKRSRIAYKPPLTDGSVVEPTETPKLTTDNDV